MDENRNQKIDNIESILKSLICFTSAEKKHYSENVKQFPPEGLDAFLVFLKMAKTEQNELLEKAINKNRNFSRDFFIFLDNTTSKIKNRYERCEKASAETILKKIS